MLKKTLQLTIGLFLIGSSTFAQWGGSTTTTGDTYRDGNVGIGTTTPTAPLTVSTGGPIISLFKHTGTANAAITVANNTGFMNLGIGATTPHPYVWSNTGRLFIGDDGNPTMFIGMGNGNVGIGTVNTGSFKLAVEGKIGAREVQVTLANPFPDYVFASNYKLRSLFNLETYINQNKHLPGIPSAAEVEKNGGIELGQMNTKLLEKIEELTLYVIEINKKVERLEKENKTLKGK
jgi:hypothetical protein